MLTQVIENGSLNLGGFLGFTDWDNGCLPWFLSWGNDDQSPAVFDCRTHEASPVYRGRELVLTFVKSLLRIKIKDVAYQLLSDNHVIANWNKVGNAGGKLHLREIHSVRLIVEF